MSSVAKYAKPFYFNPFWMMQHLHSVVEHLEIEHQSQVSRCYEGAWSEALKARYL